MSVIASIWFLSFLRTHFVEEKNTIYYLVPIHFFVMFPRAARLVVGVSLPMK